MAGSQRVGTVLQVNDTHQVEGVFAFVRTIHITDAIAIIENGALDLFGHVFSTHPSAVVTLVGVRIDKRNGVLGSHEVGSQVLHVLQSILTVFQRRLDFENDIVDIASFVGLITVFVFLVEGLVVGIGHHDGRIRNSGITQGDDIG